MQVLPGGGVANVQGVQNGDADLGFANSISTVDAIEGREPFTGEADNVCNVATQHGETDDFGYEDHIREVVHYLGPNELDFAIVNSNEASDDAIRPEHRDAALRGQLEHLADPPVAPHALHEPLDLDGGDDVVADQAEAVGRRGGEEDVVVGLEHDDALGQHAQQGDDVVVHRVLGHLLLPAAQIGRASCRERV